LAETSAEPEQTLLKHSYYVNASAITAETSARTTAISAEALEQMEMLQCSFNFAETAG
jgi:hypothetical protein